MKRLLLILAFALVTALAPLAEALHGPDSVYGELPMLAPHGTIIHSEKGYSFRHCPARVGYTNRAITYIKPATATEPAKFASLCEYGLDINQQGSETPYGTELRLWAQANGFGFWLTSSSIHGPITFNGKVFWPSCISNAYQEADGGIGGDTSCGYYDTAQDVVPQGAAVNISLVAAITQTVSTPDGAGEFYGFIPGSQIISVSVQKPNGVFLNQPTITSCPSGPNPEKQCASWTQVIPSGSKVTVTLDVMGFGVEIGALKPYVHTLSFYCRTVTGQVRCDADSRAPIPYGQP